MDIVLGHRLINLRSRIVATFDANKWEEIGLLTGMSKLIDGHPRLLRSLAWNDEDYAGNVLTILREISERDVSQIETIENFLDGRFPDESEYVSAKPSTRRVTFSPYVFQIPEFKQEADLLAVMMPFSSDFSGVHLAIKEAATACSLRCLRADDIWEDSTIVQDIFNLIFRANVIVVDFTNKNANVMYETGIAHTLGKHVIPISQSLDYVPFDMRHHRVLLYLPNAEGLKQLTTDLKNKLSQFSEPQTTSTSVADEDDGLPF